MAYSDLAGICILPFLPQLERPRFRWRSATSKVATCPNFSSRHLYLCVAHRDDMASFLPAVLRGRASTWSSCAKRSFPTHSRLATARVMAPICRDFGVPFIVNDSPELGAGGWRRWRARGVKTTSASTAVERSWAPSPGRASHARHERIRRGADTGRDVLQRGTNCAHPHQTRSAGNGRRLRRSVPSSQRPAGLRDRPASTWKTFTFLVQAGLRHFRGGARRGGGP